MSKLLTDITMRLKRTVTSCLKMVFPVVTFNALNLLYVRSVGFDFRFGSRIPGSTPLALVRL
jgi:hypothetical protein